MIAPIILFILFVISAYFVVRPFLSSSPDGFYQTPDYTPSAKELQKISLLKQIREVEFEREMGITTEEDFQRIRSELVDEVGGLLKQQKPPARKVSNKKSGSIACSGCRQPVNPEDKFCGHCGKSLEKARCGKCGAGITPDAKFCSGCGAKLA